MRWIAVALTLALALTPGPLRAQHAAGGAVMRPAPVGAGPGNGGFRTFGPGNRINGPFAPFGRIGGFGARPFPFFGFGKDGFGFRHRHRGFFQPSWWWGWGTTEGFAPFDSFDPPPAADPPPYSPAYIPAPENFTCLDAVRIVRDAGQENVPSGRRELTRTFVDPGGLEALANALGTAGYNDVQIVNVERSEEGLRATYRLGPRDASLC